MSPELIDSKLTSKADVWAIGCLILQLITGVLPFHGMNNDIQISMRIISEVTPLAYAKQYLRQELFGADSMEEGDSLYCRDSDL